jgi:hypothetical protein
MNVECILSGKDKKLGKEVHPSEVTSTFAFTTTHSPRSCVRSSAPPIYWREAFRRGEGLLDPSGSSLQMTVLRESSMEYKR